jgi:2,3-dimethylmalate lyase
VLNYNFGRNMMNKQKTFKDLVNSKEILVLPCCHDGLSAKIFEEAGFKAIVVAGYGVTGSLF